MDRFEQWVKSIFAHLPGDPNWDSARSFQDPQGEECIEFITKLFTDVEFLEEYSHEQVNEGLNYLINPSCSAHMFALYDEAVPLNKRLHCLSSFHNLFSHYFAKQCSAKLSHLDEQPCHAVNRVCYMWWDVIPLVAQPNDAAKRKLDQPILELMAKILKIDAIACQESALHGLGHWHHGYPKEVEQIIGSFLEQDHDYIADNLLAYAESARTGCVN